MFIYYCFGKTVLITKKKKLHLEIMKRIILLLLTLSPFSVISQWNSYVSVNMAITPNNTGASLPVCFYSNNGYFFTYAHEDQYKVNLYNIDGTQAWSQAMLANNHIVNGAIYRNHVLLDNSGNLIHISHFFGNDGNNYNCTTKISPNGTQLWNGSSGIVNNGFAIGAYVSASNDLYVAYEKSLTKYNSAGLLQWTTTFDNTSRPSSNANIFAKSDGTVSVVFFNSLDTPGYGNFYHDSIGSNGTLINSYQIQNEPCRFWTPSKLLNDTAENLYFLYTNHNGKGYIQKIVSNNLVFASEGLAIDDEASLSSEFQSALIKDGVLHIL